MLAPTHRLFVHIFAENGDSVCRREAGALQPLYEDMLFAAVRSGHLPDDERPPAGTLEPVWKDGVVAGVAASLAGVTKTYSLDVFRHEVYAFLVSLGCWKSGEAAPTYRWRVEAEQAIEPAARKLQARVRRRPYPFDGRAPASMGVPVEDGSEDAEFRVFVAASVVEQLRRETANSLAVERADMLCGVLLRDRRSAAVVVTSRFPLAFQTEASAAHVAFSPLTFQAAQQEHLRRGNGDHLVGWHHNHPPRCGQECLLAVPACDNDSVFLSVDDYAVFLASFASPYMVGLISGKGKGRRADDPIVRAYGWTDGVVKEIPFTVFGE